MRVPPGAQGVTWQLTGGVVKNIIPAIASTNAIVAATCALEALKLVTMCSTGINNYMLCARLPLLRFDRTELPGVPRAAGVADPGRRSCLAMSVLPWHILVQEAESTAQSGHTLLYCARHPPGICGGWTCEPGASAASHAERMSKLSHGVSVRFV